MVELSPLERANEARRAMYQEQILAAAERCCARTGYERTRMEDIAKEASVGLATLYRHYEGKQQLHDALERTRVEQLLDEGRRSADDADDPVDALVAFVSGYYRFLLDNPDTLRMQLRSQASWGLDDGHPSWRDAREHHAALVSRCIDAGRIVDLDPMLIARTMSAMHQVQLADWIERGMVDDHDEQVAAMVTLLVRAFDLS